MLHQYEGKSKPLILTLELDEASFEVFDALRKEHFPPLRNVLPAHLTLFHALPGEYENTIREHISEVAQSNQECVLNFSGLRFLGRGVAIEVKSEALDIIRGIIAKKWLPLLSTQDRQPFRPHVTIQNKSDPKIASALYRKLENTWHQSTGTGKGLHLWRYQGGLWESLQVSSFNQRRVAKEK